MMALLAGLLVLAGCGPKPTPAGEDPVFVVNGRQGDSSLSPSADVQTLRFDVYCEEEWTMKEEGLPADWLLVESVKSNKRNTWTLSVSLSENVSSSPRTAVLVFTCGQKTRKVTIVQSVEDPIFRTHVIGAYGVPGGDVVFDRKRHQFGQLRNGGDYLSFRLLDPESGRAITLSGLSNPLEPGMHFTVLYRVSDHGFTRVCETYDVQVIRVRDNKVWLKKDEAIYFVVKQW